MFASLRDQEKATSEFVASCDIALWAMFSIYHRQRITTLFNFKKSAEKRLTTVANYFRIKPVDAPYTCK